MRVLYTVHDVHVRTSDGMGCCVVSITIHLWYQRSVLNVGPKPFNCRMLPFETFFFFFENKEKLKAQTLHCTCVEANNKQPLLFSPPFIVF